MKKQALIQRGEEVGKNDRGLNDSKGRCANATIEIRRVRKFINFLRNSNSV